jgi:hypothetical protein
MFTAQMKSWFFDTQRVIRAVEKGRIRALSKVGAFVRTRMKSIIRKRKKISQPGSPPSSHIGLLKKLIFFAYDPGPASVVIGPALTTQTSIDAAGRPIQGAIPGVLERGGQIRVREPGWWRRGGGRAAPMRVVTVAARPYAGPALAAEQRKIPEAFRDCVAP